MVLTIVLSGCAPLTPGPTWGVPISQSTTVDAKAAVIAANPGKVVLVVAGVFSALLVLLYVMAGNDLGGN